MYLFAFWLHEGVKWLEFRGFVVNLQRLFDFNMSVLIVVALKKYPRYGLT